MAVCNRKIKKANHGKRPQSRRNARRFRRAKTRT